MAKQMWIPGKNGGQGRFYAFDKGTSSKTAAYNRAASLRKQGYLSQVAHYKQAGKHYYEVYKLWKGLPEVRR